MRPGHITAALIAVGALMAGTLPASATTAGPPCGFGRRRPGRTGGVGRVVVVVVVVVARWSWSGRSRRRLVLLLARLLAAFASGAG